MGLTSAERQRAFREKHREDPNYHVKRSQYINKQNIKRKLRRNVERTLKERNELRAALNAPDTNTRNRRKLKESSLALGMFMHFKSLLTNQNAEVRLVGLAWFRAIRGEANPYKVHSVPYPPGFKFHELEQAAPNSWKFHSSDLTKCKYNI
jgi:hypothetical protein